MANVLIIDDDNMICKTISKIVKHMGHSTTSAHTLQAARKEMSSKDFDVVLLDVRMPDGNGLDIVPDIRESRSAPEIIIITGYGDPDGAELAIKSNVWDYLEKPFSQQKITLTLTRALQYQKEKESRGLKALKCEGIIGNSPQIRACLDLIAQAANTDANVLISGETGTGKELFAWTIHTNSPRAHKNFVVVDCTSLPKTLVESMLFGHEKGAFTGADQTQDGLIRQADGGTLFLDEVGELPLSIQKKFLRVLEERRFRRIGGVREMESDFRLIAASNRGLSHLVQQKQFREDLLFRLRTFTIELPPLKERPKDIKELTEYYMAKLSEEYGTEKKKLSPEFMNTLTLYPWPGNVRELIHALERALTNGQESPVLYPKHLPTHIRTQIVHSQLSNKVQGKESAQKRFTPSGTLPMLQKVREAALAEVEQHYLKDLVSHTGGDINKACQISGLSRSRLYTLLKKYQIATSA